MLQIKTFLKFIILKKLYIEERTLKIRRRDMAFLALASQKSLLTLQKNFLQYQLIGIQNDVQYASAQMEAVRKSTPEGEDYAENATYLYYEQLDEQLQTEKDSIDSQITVVENEISSLKTLVNNNIKTSCTLNLASGG